MLRNMLKCNTGMATYLYQMNIDLLLENHVTLHCCLFLDDVSFHALLLFTYFWFSLFFLNRLADFAKLYDVIKNERNKCVNLIQTSTQVSCVDTAGLHIQEAFLTHAENITCRNLVYFELLLISNYLTFLYFRKLQKWEKKLKYFKTK